MSQNRRKVSSEQKKKKLQKDLKKKSVYLYK